MKPNARFWVWWHGGWVKLTLRPGQMVEMSCGGPTDEGWHSEYRSFYYDPDTDTVLRRDCSDGCDCDGRHGREDKSRCRVKDLPTPEERVMTVEADGDESPFTFVKWEDRGGSQYDQFAEAAGY